MVRFPFLAFFILCLAFVILLLTLSPHYQASLRISQGELNSAQQVLIDFYQALNAKNYPQAVSLYQGDYQFLIDWNPADIASQKEKLWQNGCEINGLHCLKIKNILNYQNIGENKYRFLVQFANNDGSVFIRRPYCGASEKDQPSTSRFDQEVIRQDNKYYVVSQPIYTP